MNQIYSTIISPATLVLCLSIYAMMYVLRTIMESVSGRLRGSFYWREAVLPALAIACGAASGILLSSFSWPELHGSSLNARVVYGSLCGVLSTFAYGRVKSWRRASKKETSRNGS